MAMFPPPHRQHEGRAMKSFLGIQIGSVLEKDLDRFGIFEFGPDALHGVDTLFPKIALLQCHLSFLHSDRPGEFWSVPVTQR